MSDEQIVAAWRENEAPWIAAVRGAQIESRRLVTDDAVVAAVTRRSPGSILDVGCGEGWLLRRLAHAEARLVGADAAPGLIEAARSAGGAQYHVASHAELAGGVLAETFDVVVCNFSLLGEASANELIAAAPGLLRPSGAFIVQTLHPVMACGEARYEDGWRAGSWGGCSDDFTEAPPWYFRTLASWMDRLGEAGFRRIELREPVHPRTGQPVSALFIAARDSAA